MSRRKGILVFVTIEQIDVDMIEFISWRTWFNKASHKWVCFVKGYNGEDISHYISRVVFTLHPTFNNPVRAIDTPPYEIHEYGWGEFEI